jgi:hypothetical protein
LKTFYEMYETANEQIHDTDMNRQDTFFPKNDGTKKKSYKKCPVTNFITLRPSPLRNTETLILQNLDLNLILNVVVGGSNKILKVYIIEMVIVHKYFYPFRYMCLNSASVDFMNLHIFCPFLTGANRELQGHRCKNLQRQE